MSRRAPNQRGLCIVEPASLAIKSRLAVVAWAWLILAPTRRNEEQLGAGLSGEAGGGSNPSLPARPARCSDPRSPANWREVAR